MRIAIASREYVIKKMVELGAHPLKKWGQNFLVDEAIAKEIVFATKISKTDRVLEVGPGLGALSEYIAQTGAQIDLLDIDPLFCEHLRKTFSQNPSIHVILGDVMKFDLSQYNKIFGNLPYYLTTPILERVIENIGQIQSLTAMIQKEAYPRLIAKLGDEDYGPLSILYAYVGQISLVRKVSKVHFLPAPHVDSLVFKVDFRPNLDPIFVRKLASTTKNLFLLRRKTILNNLSGMVGGKEKASVLLNKLGIDFKKRPEELSLQFYVALSELLSVESKVE